MATLPEAPAPVNGAGSAPGTRPADGEHIHLPHASEVVARPDSVVTVVEDTDLEDCQPPPFPEPESAALFHPVEADRVAIFRAAWPVLDDQLRAEVTRLLDIYHRSALDRQEANEFMVRHLSPAERKRVVAARRKLAPAWAGLDVLEDAATELADHIRADGPDQYACWLADLDAVGHLARVTADAAADALDLPEREREREGVISAPELSEGYDARPTDERLAEFLAYAELCLKPVAAYAAAEADNPDLELKAIAASCRHAHHLVGGLVMWDMQRDGQTWPSEDKHEAAAERIKLANA